MAVDDHPVDRVFRAQRSPELSQPVMAFVTRSLPNLSCAQTTHATGVCQAALRDMGDMYFSIKGS